MHGQHVSGLVLAATIALALPDVAGAAPVTVQYPSVECLDTGAEGLQQCIDAVDPGSTVVLATEIIDESAVIEKSLTLRAVDRELRPVLKRVVLNSPDAGTVKILVQDIRLTSGVSVNLFDGSGHSLTLRRIYIGIDALDPAEPQGVSVTIAVPSSITIENSFIRSDQEDQENVIGLLVDNPQGQVRLRIVGNRITAEGDTDSSSGIDLDMGGLGSVKADIYNNVIWDVASCNCGASSGLSIDIDPEFSADVNVVGNTFDRSLGDGLQLRNDLTTGKLALDVFNNIFSNNDNSGIDLEAGLPGSLAFHGGFNDFFSNGEPNNFDGKSTGSDNLKVNPRYVDRGGKNFRLKSNSPLIDKGLTCSPGGVANPGADGRHRLKGPTVDIGAYERDAPKINGKVLLGRKGRDQLNGTEGRDILCGYEGPDEIHGKGGADFIDGGPGRDRLFGEGGVDRVLGNSGNDTLCMRDGQDDIADGGAGTDVAKTDSGDTRISIEGQGADCAL